MSLQKKRRNKAQERQEKAAKREPYASDLHAQKTGEGRLNLATGSE